MLSISLMHREIVCKCIGSMMLLLSGIICGLRYRSILGQRLEQIKCLSRILLRIHSEIRCTLTTLPECFQLAGSQEQDVVGQWFENVGKQLKSNGCLSLEQVWNNEVQSLQRQSCLGKEELQELLRFGLQLGTLDKQMQLNLIEQLQYNLDTLYHRLDPEIRKKQKLYTSLGILGSLFVIILLV